MGAEGTAGGGQDPLDPRGVIREAYRMAGLGREACRAVLLDWALGRSPDEGSADAVRALHARYAPRYPDHPMTAALAEGLVPASPPSRRGGRRGRG